MISYLRSVATMGLFRTVFEIDGDFSRQSPNFPTPVYFAPLLKGFPLELSIGARGQKLEDGATGPRKRFNDIFSRLDTIHQRDRETDTGRQQRPRLRIASRGNNGISMTLRTAVGPQSDVIQSNFSRSRRREFASPQSAFSFVFFF